MAASPDPEAYARSIGFVKDSWRQTGGGSAGQRAETSALSLDCIHRGAETGEVADCKTCRGKIKLKMLECVIHGRCTIGKPIPGTACCRHCPDREAPK